MARKRVHVEFDAVIDGNWEPLLGSRKRTWVTVGGEQDALIIPATATITETIVLEDGYYFNDARGAFGCLYRRVGGIWETRVDGDWSGAAYNTDAGHTEDLYLGPLREE